MKRLNELRKCNNNLAQIITMRQKLGSMSKFIDKDGYVCYDETELAEWKPKKVGRKSKYEKRNSD